MDPNSPYLLPNELQKSVILVATTRDEPEIQDPRLRRLAEDIQFSGRFAGTYNIVLLLLLALISCSYHVKRRKQRTWRHISRADDGQADMVSEDARMHDIGYNSSESSSILMGIATPPDVKHTDEEGESTPLIGKRGKTRRKWTSIHASVRAFVMYQPRPIPIINKTLPSNATSLAILGLYSLNVFYILFRIPWEARSLLILSDRFGLMFVVNLPLLYLFAAKNQPLRRWTGHSYEELNIFHRRLGEMMCLFALFHMLGFFTVWYTILLPYLHVTLYHFLSLRTVWVGLGAFTSFELLYFTSLGSFRQRWYELFLASHVFLQLAAAIFLWFHYIRIKVYVGLAIVIFCIDRIVYRIFLNTLTIQAALDVLDDGESVMMSCNWAIPPTSARGRSIAPGWRAGDHVFLTVPALSGSDCFRAHPFTIASAAPIMSALEPHAWLSLLIRAQGGFSRQLVDFAHQHSTVQVRLDGPYGSSRPLNHLRESDLAIVVAGGSGIAVAFPLIWELLLQQQEDGLPKVDLYKHRKQTVCLVWIVHSPSHLSWLPKQRLDELKELGLELCIPPPTITGGRPDIAEIVQGLIYQHEDRSKSAVLVSGPDGMNRDVRNVCSSLVREGLDVSVQVEKFGW